jgi:hypothetical protein
MGDDRITVTLVRKAREELNLLQQIEELSKTDVINRAIILYAFVAEQTAAGKQLFVRDVNSGEVERVHLL